MTKRLVVVTAAAGAAALAFVLYGCGGSPSTAPGGPAVSSPADPSATVANPNAPETNPAGDIPGTTVYVPFHSARVGWKVSIPQGWARSDTNGVMVFTDKLNAVRLQTVPAATAATEASVIPPLLASDPTAKVDAITTVSRTSGPVIETTYTRDNALNAVTGKAGRDAAERHDFFHNGATPVVTLAGPVGADNVDPWRTITDSVSWAR